jgi:hypothetical protein
MVTRGVLAQEAQHVSRQPQLDGIAPLPRHQSYHGRPGRTTWTARTWRHAGRGGGVAASRATAIPLPGLYTHASHIIFIHCLLLGATRGAARWKSKTGARSARDQVLHLMSGIILGCSIAMGAHVIAASIRGQGMHCCTKEVGSSCVSHDVCCCYCCSSEP